MSNSLPFFFFFFLHFFLIHSFLPPFPSNIFSFPPLTILSLLQVFFLTQNTVLLLHPKDKIERNKLHKKMREEAATAEEESCNYVGIEEEACSSRRRITVFFYFLFYFFIEVLVKLGFQNKNNGSLGIMLKMTNGKISNAAEEACVFGKAAWRSIFKTRYSFVFGKVAF